MKNKLLLFFFNLNEYNIIFNDVNKNIKYLDNFNNYLYNKNNFKNKIFLNAKKYIIYNNTNNNSKLYKNLLEKFLYNNKENLLYIFYNKNFFLPKNLKFLINCLVFDFIILKKINNFIHFKKLNFLIFKFLILLKIKNKKCQL